MDLSFRAIARNLNISVGTVHNIFTRFKDTCEVSSQAHRKHERKLDEHHESYIVCLVINSPTLYLHEVVEKVYEITGTSVSVPTICRLLAKHGITRKKVKQTAIQRNMAFRGAYFADISQYSRDMFVWVDETGSDARDMLRKYGYAIRGERASVQRLFVRGNRVSSIAAISSIGLMDVHSTLSTNTGETFFDFIRGSVIPNMHPYPDSRSILIMDNCSIHHVDCVQDFIKDCGILLIYLPPYSPDYNPIESVFGFLKDHFEKA